MPRGPGFEFGLPRFETARGRDSGQLADAVQERGPLPEQDGHAAAEVGDRPELAEDQRSVAEDIPAGDEAADRHPRSLTCAPPGVGCDVHASERAPAFLLFGGCGGLPRGARINLRDGWSVT